MHLEFGNRVHRRIRAYLISGNARIIAPIHGEVISPVDPAINTDIRNVVAPGAETGIDQSPIADHARRQIDHRKSVAPVERQIADFAFSDHLAGGRGGGVHQGRVGYYFDGLVNVPHLQPHVHARGLIHGQRDACPDNFLEPVCTGGYGVLADCHRRCSIEALRVGFGPVRNVGLGIGYGDQGAWYGSSRTIANNALDRSPA